MFLYAKSYYGSTPPKEGVVIGLGAMPRNHAHLRLPPERPLRRRKNEMINLLYRQKTPNKEN